MREEEKILGYDESEIRELFNSKKEVEAVNTTEIQLKIQSEKTTLETLLEGSKELLNENPEFLREIYGEWNFRLSKKTQI